MKDNNIFLILNINDFVKNVITNNDILINILDTYKTNNLIEFKYWVRNIEPFFDTIFINFKLEKKIELNKLEMYVIIYTLGILDQEKEALIELFFNIQNCYWYTDFLYKNNNIKITKILNRENTEMFKLIFFKNIFNREFIEKYEDFYKN